MSENVLMDEIYFHAMPSFAVQGTYPYCMYIHGPPGLSGSGNPTDGDGHCEVITVRKRQIPHASFAKFSHLIL